jgi:hypothetical protein
MFLVAVFETEAAMEHPKKIRDHMDGILESMGFYRYSDAAIRIMIEKSNKG